jgi:small subunit ribosomal protein S3
MGQKVNPISFRLQVHKNWESRWFAPKRDFAKLLIEDIRIRELIEKRFESRPTISRIEIERSANLVTITIHTAKAGVVIGRGGVGVTELKTLIEKITSLPIRLNIEEVKRPELAAKLVAENIARQLELTSVAQLKCLLRTLWQPVQRVYVFRLPDDSITPKWHVAKKL